ncbi:mandelate racemase/muconate lactonizing enzyme family protein [Bacteroidota bacterium]
MKITSVSYYPIEMQLARPYTIAYEKIEKASNVVLKIQTDKGLTGWGLAAPDKVITGETSESVVENFRSIAEPLLIGKDPFQWVYFMEEIKSLLSGNASTKAAVDMALLDLLARKARLPLYRVLGGHKHMLRTSVTIGIETVQETLDQAGYYLKKGFNVIKLKGGLNLEEDVEKVWKLRERFNNEFILRFDANQGYTVEEAIEFVRRTKDAEIEILEQPTKASQPLLMGEVVKHVDIPVMADESIKSLKDVYKLVSNELIDMVNIKIQKVGGILESLHINSVSRAAGAEVMVGCLDESALGISAGLHFALSRSNIEYADLDGHLDLIDDPFMDLFELKNGILYPVDYPGLGKISLA